MIAVSAILMATALVATDDTIKVYSLCLSCLILMVCFSENDSQKGVDDDE